MGYFPAKRVVFLWALATGYTLILWGVFGCDVGLFNIFLLLLVEAFFGAWAGCGNMGYGEANGFPEDYMLPLLS